MSLPDTSWNTRLAVRYTDAAGEHVITPIQSFSPTFALSAEPLHSIERTHVGVVATPQSFTFTMSVSAIGPVAAQLTALALNGTRFDITLMEQDGNDFSFSTIVMQAVLTNASTTVNVSGAPTVTFSGFAMHADVTDSTGTRTSGPRQSTL
jgi:hypothetical protein